MTKKYSPIENNSIEQPGKRGTTLLQVIILGILLFILWGVYDGKLTFRMGANPGLGKLASSQKIEVPQEVYNLQESFARVSEVVKPAVVNISTIHLEKYHKNPYEFFFMNPEDLFEQFFNDPSQPRQRKNPHPQRKYYQRKVPGTGSGVIIDPKGYILTNEHVVRGADEIIVTLSDDPEKTYEGKVIGRDERTDLAVVKIKASGDLPFARLGDSDSIRVGDWAIAIGSPFGLQQTVTVGVISASRQNLAIEGRNYRTLIQTDAAINPGNSGGPLLNIQGEVIGINTAIYTPSGGFAGVGFAIPINRAKEIIPQLREKGKVVRGWIGVILEEKIDDATASVFGVKDGDGSMIRDVLPNFPADKGGLKRGDIIREFAGKKIKNNTDLQSIVSSTPPKKKVRVKIIRNRKEKTLTLVVAEAPSSLREVLKEGKRENQPKGAETEATWLGAKVKELNPGLRERFGIGESEDGVIVSELEEGSKAEEVGLLPGDLIRAINQNPTENIRVFNEVTKKIKTRKGVVFDILRRGELRYLSYMGPEK